MISSLLVRRIVSDEEKIDTRLVRRGYPSSLVQQHKMEALALERGPLLYPRQRDGSKRERVPFISTFGSQSGWFPMSCADIVLSSNRDV